MSYTGFLGGFLASGAWKPLFCHWGIRKVGRGANSESDEKLLVNT